MRASIRASILIFFLTLLSIIGIVIISTNYYTLDTILLKTAKKSISQSAKLIDYQVTNYLQSLNDHVNMAAKFIEHGIITPGLSKEFRKFLVKLIIDKPNITGSYWAEPTGNLYLVEKRANNILIGEMITRNSNPPRTFESKLNSKGDYIGKVKITPVSFDPRVRPWYKKTLLKKQLAWTLYPFKAFQGNKEHLGITASYPIYKSNGKLKGIFSLDLTLDTISKYISKLKITKNTTVFICNDQRQLMTTHLLNNSASNDNTLPTLDNLNRPWAAFSFKEHQRLKKPMFFYTYKGKKYIAAYKKIRSLMNNEWSVAIIMPINDIIGPLKQLTLLSIVLTVIIFIAGIICIIFISNSISKPIVILAKEAKKIEELNIGSPLPLRSYIKEIILMKNAFNAMKVALKSFQCYLPYTLVKKLVASGQVAKVGGEIKPLTFLFSDIKGFTSVAENMDPQALMKYLSEYLEAMTNIIIDKKGTVDKYIGDAIMAFWGAPQEDAQQARHACHAALAMQDKLKQLNQHWQQQGKPTLSVRTGINTGEAVIGNVGSSDRLNYTAIGDTVNLASRLEPLNKLYHTDCIVSENTYAAVHKDFLFRLLDLVSVKGKTQAVYIYELLGRKDDTLNLNLTAYNKAFKRAFESYQSGQWQEAIVLFSELTKQHPDDYLLQLYLERCHTYKTNPPSNWNGIWVLRRKDD